MKSKNCGKKLVIKASVKAEKDEAKYQKEKKKFDLVGMVNNKT